MVRETTEDTNKELKELNITVELSNLAGKGGLRYYPRCPVSKALTTLMQRKALVKNDFRRIYNLTRMMGISLKITKVEPGWKF